MDITVLHVEDCPHVAVARQRIAEALDRAGVSATATERLVCTEAEAETWGFRGSPTILIDGADPFPADGASGLSCRLYPGEAGAQGAPTVDHLVEVLTARRDRGLARDLGVFGLLGAALCCGLPLLLVLGGTRLDGVGSPGWLVAAAVGILAVVALIGRRRRRTSRESGGEP